MVNLQYKKCVQAINFFALKEGGKINRMKMLKLIWLSDRLHLQKYGRTVSKDKYIAMVNGPVASLIKNISEEKQPGYSFDFIRPSSRYDVISVAELDLKFFSSSDLEVLNTIWETYGSEDQFKLSDISHYYPEWLRFKKALKNKASHEMIMEDFFEKPLDSDKAKSELFNLSDDNLSSSKQLFGEMANFKRIIRELENV